MGAPKVDNLVDRMAKWRHQHPSATPSIRPSHVNLMVDRMVRRLRRERWKGDECLPQGWRFKWDSKSNESSFLTKDLSRLSSRDAAEDFIKAHLSSEDLELFSKFLPPMEDDHTLPVGWKMKRGNCGKVIFVSPSGNWYKNRRLALKSMAEEEPLVKGRLDMMRATLVKEGWREDKRLPLNWRVKTYKKSILFLNETADVLNVGMALKVITREGCEGRDFDLFKEVAELPDWPLEEDDSLPKGWKRKAVVENPLFVAPTGQHFANKISALNFMIANGFPYDEVGKIILLLLHFFSLLAGQCLTFICQGGRDEGQPQS